MLRSVGELSSYSDGGLVLEWEAEVKSFVIIGACFETGRKGKKMKAVPCLVGVGCNKVNLLILDCRGRIVRYCDENCREGTSQVD